MSQRDTRRDHLGWTARAAVEVIRQRNVAWVAPEVRRKTQGRRVQRMVAYAAANVPYYRETMRRLALSANDFGSAADLGRLPVIEREHLQRDPEYYVSDRWPAHACIRLESGGTTGEPITFFRDPVAVFAGAVHYERMRVVVRRRVRRGVRLREAVILPPDSSGTSGVSAFLTRSYLPQWLRVDGRAFSMLRPPDEIVDELQDFRPHVIRSYGSYLDAILVHMRMSEMRFATPPVMTFGSDPISDAMREWAQQSLAIEVLGAYGAIEASQIGFECDHHSGYHLNLDLYPIRLFDASDHEVPVGEAGEVIVSNLVNSGTVLLNYRLGDQLCRIGSACTCGRTLPLVSYLSRTKAAWLHFGNDRQVHAQALRGILRHEQEVWRYQIIQEAPRKLLLRLIASPVCDRAATTQRLRQAFREQLFPDVVIRVEFVDELPRSSSDKIPSVVPLAGTGP